MCWLLSLVSKIFFCRLFWEAAFFKLAICSQFGLELPYHKSFSMARTKNLSPCCRERSVILNWYLYFWGRKPWFSGTLKPVFGGIEKASSRVMRVVHYLRGIIYLYASCLARFAKPENLDLLVPEIGMEAFNGLVLYGGGEEKQRKVRRWLQGWLELCIDDVTFFFFFLRINSDC